MLQQIYLNSKNASYRLNASSDMIFSLNHPIVVPPGYQMRIRISDFVFPISFYLVDTNNNKLVISGTSYTLTSGNYTATTLMAHVLSILPVGFSMTYSSITNKYTISNATSFSLDATSTCLTLLGFTTAASGTSITSDSVVNLSGQYNVLYIDIPNLATYNITSSNGRRTSVIASVPVSEPLGTVMFWEGRDHWFDIPNEYIGYLHIRILGEDMVTPVDFQGQAWNMTVDVAYS